MSNQRKIAAQYIFTNEGLLPQSILCLNSSGIVEDIVRCRDIDRQSGVEFYNGILIPDMVNAHCHLELSYLHSAIEKGTGFAGFAQAIARVRSGFSDSEREAAARYYDAKMYAEGVGAVGDICNGSSTVALKRESRIIYRSFAEVFGLQTRDLSPINGVVSDFETHNLDIFVTPHSVYSLNNEAFIMAVSAHQDPQAPLSIHFMESDAELELFSRRGHLWQWYEQTGKQVDFLDSRSPVERIISNIPASRKVLLVHCTKIKDEDIARLVEHFGHNLTCVVCPSSNMYIEGQTIDIEVLRRSCCRIAVGSDSLASADNMSVLEQIKYFENVPLEQRLSWITSGGAQALGLDDVMGTFRVGERSGVVLVSGVDFAAGNLRADASARRLI